MNRRDAGRDLWHRLQEPELGESPVENALMLVLFAVTLVAIVSILLLVDEQVHSVVSTVSDGVNQ